MNGQLVPWESATTHVFAHALHYGTSVFEGIRCYETQHDGESGRAIFRLESHIRRLIDSAKIYRFPMPYSHDEIKKACHDVIQDNDLSKAYIRPLIFRGVGPLGVVPGDEVATDVMVAAIEWGAYLGDDGIKNGIDCCVSSWQRLTSASNPVLSKAGGHYLNSQLIAMDARRNGYTEAIVVDSNGMIGEGSAENIFIVRDNVIYTPPISAGILGGITRASIIELAESIGLDVKEEMLPRDLLYIADEIFLTGTAAEVTPVRSVDKLPVGEGKPGPITKSVQDAFFGLFSGSTEDKWGWLDHVAAGAATG